jgi:hypothetical protein
MMTIFTFGYEELKNLNGFNYELCTFLIGGGAEYRDLRLRNLLALKTYHDLIHKKSTLCKLEDIRFNHIGHTKLRSYELNGVNVSPTSPTLSRYPSLRPI